MIFFVFLFVVLMDKLIFMLYHIIMKTIISIIPEPQETRVKNGLLLTNNNFSIAADDFFNDYADFLCKELQKCNVKCKINDDSKSKTSTPVQIKLTKTDSNTQTKEIIPESYTLDINDNEILIQAADKAGALFAIQTLKQLILSNEGFLPCLSIKDFPQYKWRGFMLDTSRNYFSIDFIKKVLDLASFHKMNRFHWHLTDDQGWRIHVPEYPLLTEIGSIRDAHTMPLMKDYYCDFKKNLPYYYTDEEITEIVKYAEKLNITIIPELELTGHVSALLASYPEFGCTGGPYKVENRWGIFNDVLCIGNENLPKIYQACLRTVVRLFPGQWIHIGGDECPSVRWRTCPKCQALKAKLNLTTERQLQSWLTKEISEYVVSLGKTPIGWDEVLDNTEIIPLPKDTVVQSWRKKGGGKKAVSLKHFAIMSPVNKCYLNFKNYDSFEEPGRLSFTTTKTTYGFTPAGKDFSQEDKKYMLGAECNLWTEDLNASKVAEYMMFPRFCALSESMWLDADKKDFARFRKSLEAHKLRLDFMDVNYYKGKLGGD